MAYGMKVDTIIITIYSETKQTVWLTSTSKKCIRILHIGVATRGVRSGFGEGGGIGGGGDGKNGKSVSDSFFSPRLNMQARWRVRMWCTVPLRGGVSGFWERPGEPRACVRCDDVFLSRMIAHSACFFFFFFFVPFRTPARSQKHRVIHRELNLGRSTRTGVVNC